MANLTSAQKNTIHNKANGINGETKVSGSALAKEYKVSASAISNIKNHYTPTVEAKSKKKSAKKKAPKKAKNVAKRTVIVHSPKFTGKTFEVTASTFGELLEEIGEDSSVEGIFKKAKNKKKLKALTDRLPDTGDQPLNLYLVPLKTDAGAIA